MSGFNSIASIVGGYKAGQISEQTAKRLLKELGVDNDTATLLGIGAGIVGGIVFGNVIGDAVGDILDSLFD